MRKSKINWQVWFGLGLVILSVLLYGLHYFFFKDLKYIANYFLIDLAFLPLEVLLVTMILHRLLNENEKSIRLEKLNMVIGTFFSEIGTQLLTYFSDQDPGLDIIKGHLVIREEWTERSFHSTREHLSHHLYDLDMRKVNLEFLKHFLLEKREFLLHLLENPNLLEHEEFTELLRSVFHLTEELAQRQKIKNLQKNDHDHLATDIKRVYSRLVLQWLHYMQHLKDNFPYLFSLAMRTNPFDETASPEIK